MTVFIRHKKYLGSFAPALIVFAVWLAVQAPATALALIYAPARAARNVAEISTAPSVNVLPSHSPKNNKSKQAGQSRARQSYFCLPIGFEANRGQSDPRVNFMARASGYSVYLTATEAVMALRVADSGKRNAESPKAIYGPPDSQPAIINPRLAVLRMKIVGAAPARVAGTDEIAATSNYFIGNDPNHWRANVPNYAKVRYESVYPGIDLVYYGNHRQIEYDFKLAPGADPGRIRLRYEGAQQIRIDRNGDLILGTAAGTVKQLKPIAYQNINGAKRTVAARYELRTKHEVVFKLGAYNKSLPLVIDPVLTYSTFLGGSGSDEGMAIAVDALGNAYVAGRTLSANFPTTAGVIQPTRGGDLFDAFVTKLNPAGTALVYSTYLGGFDGANFAEQGDQAFAIAVDSAGNAYVAGQTSSLNFPAPLPALQGNLAGSSDAFVTKLNPTGTAIVYSTFLGGSFTTSNLIAGRDQAFGIAVDSAGNAYVTGRTDSVDFPTASAVQLTLGGGSAFIGGDAFVAKINPAGTALIYSTYLGGNGDDTGTDIAIDSAGSAYVVGVTRSLNLATTEGAFQMKASGGSPEGFVAKIDAAGASLIYLTYLGGNDDDTPLGIAVDSSNNAYVTGSTTSIDFPTLNAFQGVNNSGPAFKSTDGGTNWKVINAGLTAHTVLGLAVDPKTTSTVYAATPQGIFKSADGGATWSAANEGLTALNVRAVAVDPKTTSTVYAGTINGGVFKSTDGGATWSSSWNLNNFGNATINQLVIDPANTSIVYAAGRLMFNLPVFPAAIATLFKSTDGGASWATIGGPVSSITSVLAIDPKAPATLYAGTTTGLFKSLNGGTSWTLTELQDLEVHSLLVNPVNTANVYAGTFNARRGRDAIYKSTNGGASWNRTEGEGELQAIDTVAPSTLYAGMPIGLSKSTDAGASWKSSDLARVFITSVVINPSSPQTLYAGTLMSDDAFVTKLNATGTALVYSTYVGGKNSDIATAIAVDAAGNAYITGITSSSDYPVNTAVQQASNDGGEFLSDAFVTEINAAGASLIFSTYIGGASSDGGSAIAVNSLGDIYITGFTTSTNFPTVAPLQSRFGGVLDGFVAKIASPKIFSVSISGKKLRVTGEGFAAGAVILINNLAQKTANDVTSPTTVLVGKKAGNAIAPGQRVTIQARNPDGSLSNQISFVRPGS